MARVGLVLSDRALVEGEAALQLRVRREGTLMFVVGLGIHGDEGRMQCANASSCISEGWVEEDV
jgi:hypothetical protein